MAKIYDLVTKVNGKGIDLVRFGYEESPEMMYMLYNMYDLNKQDLDFRNKRLKGISEKVSITEDGESITWYSEDMKEAKATIATFTSGTSWVVDLTDIQVGEELFNARTGATVIVSAVSGTTVTLNGAGDAAGQAGDTLSRVWVGKQYWASSVFTTARNDLSSATNYIQYMAVKVASDMVSNNKTRLFYENPQEFARSVFGDASRKILKSYAQLFYFGVKGKNTIGGSTVYTAGWLEEFIGAGNKVDLSGADDAATKANLRKELLSAYATGLTGVMGKNKMLAFCTSKFKAELDMLYEDKIVYNDKLQDVEIEITSYTVGGRKLNLVESTILNTTIGDYATAYLVPIDYAFVYNVPFTTVGDDGKSLQNTGKGVVFVPPQTTFETKDVRLCTTFSFMFMAADSGSYKKLYFSNTAW